MGGKAGGEGWGSRRDMSQAPGTFFFFIFFSLDYTDSSLHLQLGLPLPVMPPSQNHEKGPKRRASHRLGLM